MNFKDYLADKALLITLVLLSVLATEALLLLFEISVWIYVFIAADMLISLAVGIGFDYLRRRHYYDQIMDILSELDQKYLIHELMAAPTFYDARFLKEYLYILSKAMADEVNSQKQNQEDYREYIEMWIHDIKIPIAAGKMIAANHPDEVTASIDEELDKIDECTENALYYARSNTTEKDYLIKSYCLKDLVSESVRKNKTSLIRNKFGIELKDLDVNICTDSKWTVYIISQIISNSIKYRSEAPKLCFYAEPSADSVTLHIKDNGIGIAASETARVFDKGFTGTNGRNANKKSTGMGLYLCRKLCNKLHIGLYLDSRQGNGTDVRLVFPKGSMTELSKKII